MRRIFVGDIQGCARQLDALLVAVRLRSSDQLFLAGDLVNRGPDSLGVLRRARGLGARAVLGNHDVELLRAAERLRCTGRSDRRFAKVLDATDAAEVLEWLAAQPVLRVESDIVLVHGGLHPAWKNLGVTAARVNQRIAAHVRGTVDRTIEFATCVRYCDARGRRPPTDDPPPRPPFHPWDRFYRGRRTVVFGHWARRGLAIEKRVRGLDSGCVYGGALTAWIAEEDRLVQVPGWRG